MTNIITLVASDKNTYPLRDKHFVDIANVANFYDLEVGIIPHWLASDKAGDVAVSGEPNAALLTHFREALAGDQIDIFITPVENRKKKLLLADMDSTIVAEETLDELAAFAGLKDKVAAITAKAMNGELDFHGAVKERVGLLKDLSTSALEETLNATKINPGAKTLVQTMKAGGATCVLVSGGFTNFTDPIAKTVGFDHNHGNTLGIDGDKLTGEVIEPILDKAAKVEFLDRYCKELGVSAGDCMTIGDGANDLPMLQKAGENGGLGVGYYAKPSVADQLTNIIQYGDLSAALYAQGYREQDIEA